jgi:hypothetical protein
MEMVRLAVDFENPARKWWDNGGSDLWEGIAESVDAGSVAVERALAESWMAQAEQLPGWSGEGNEYSPHPIIIKEINDDEEV